MTKKEFNEICFRFLGDRSNPFAMYQYSPRKARAYRNLLKKSK